MDWRRKVASEGVIEVPVELELESWMRVRVGEGDHMYANKLV